MTLGELLGLIATLISISGSMWVIINRFAKLERRVDRLEEKVALLAEKVDEILFYLAPKFKRKKKKHYK